MSRPSDVIAAVRDLGPLSPESLREFVEGVADGRVSDGQLGAFLMGVRLRGLSRRLTAELALAMRDSGVTLSFSDLNRPVVDKHSTGGIGDKTSLILAPLLAALNVTVPMVSGRGLGQTGGTLDKLESIPGMRVDLSLSEFQQVVREHGVAIVAANSQIAPADARMYALRDVSATVDSPQLVASSILSKKLSEGLDGLVLDVKVGSGAFAPTIPSARRLTRLIASGAKQAGVRMTAFLTNMDRPLGRAVGNALEVQEALDILKCRGPKDATELVLALAEAMLQVAYPSKKAADVHIEVLQCLESGRALHKFNELVTAQGGSLAEFEASSNSATRTPMRAASSGYVAEIDAMKIGSLAMELGAGRSVPSDKIDHDVGFLLKVAVGDEVSEGDSLVDIFHRTPLTDVQLEYLRKAFVLSSLPVLPSPLIYERYH